MNLIMESTILMSLPWKNVFVAAKRRKKLDGDINFDAYGGAPHVFQRHEHVSHCYGGRIRAAEVYSDLDLT